MKYSLEFKIECIKKYKNEDHIIDPPVVNHHSFRGQVTMWSKIYDSLGIDGLRHGRTTLDID